VTRDRAVLVLLALVFALAMAAPLFVPESQGPHPDAAKLRLLPPLTVVHGLQGADDGDGSESRRFWLGTDSLGRDLLPRVLAGARLSLIVALLGVGGAALLAALLGVLAGYAGGAISAAVDALTDAMLSLPRIVLLMVLAFLFDPGSFGLGLLFALTGWPAMTRLVRAEVRQRAGGDLALAARAAGASPLRVAVRHVLPFALATLGVAAALRVGPYVLLEASLSFLGFGVDPPAASWGHVIADGSRFLLEAWWIATLPGIALLILVLLVNRGVDAIQFE
jgi:peptide/nickel transport system permease protein